MQTLAHEVESLLDLARNHKLKLTSPIITEILRSRDTLQLLTQQVGTAMETGVEPSSVIPVSHLIRAVKVFAVADGAAPAPATPVAAPVETPAPDPVIAFQPEPVGSEAPAAEPEPVASVTPIASVASAAPTAAKAAAAAPEKSSSSGATVRVNTEKLDSLMDVMGELVIVQSQIMESARSIAVAGSPLHRNVAQLSRITKEL